MANHEPVWVLIGPAGGGKVKWLCQACGTSVNLPPGQQPSQSRHG